ncbi:MAG TPA: hypothetical protein V6D29_23360 [Leptolyngbyaceae cyanobacterium]
MVNSSNRAAQAPPEQGIQGQVLWLDGNQMPSSTPTDTETASPVKTTLWIFSGKIAAPSGPTWPICEARCHSALVATIESDDLGYYTAALAPGEYTLLAEYGEVLYLNRFSGSGHFASVTVQPGKISEFNLHNTEAAYF